jgi:hypothetical protein
MKVAITTTIFCVTHFFMISSVEDNYIEPTVRTWFLYFLIKLLSGTALHLRKCLNLRVKDIYY